MLNKLKLFSSMSGMQKIVLSENENLEDLQSLSVSALKSKLAKAVKDNDGITADTIKTVLANKESVSKEITDKAEKSRTKPRLGAFSATSDILASADIAGDLSFVEAEAARRKAAVDKKIQDLESLLGNPSLIDADIKIQELTKKIESDTSTLDRLDKVGGDYKPASRPADPTAAALPLGDEDNAKRVSANKAAQQRATQLRVSLKRDNAKLNQYKELIRLYKEKEHDVKSVEGFNDLDKEKAKKRALYAAGRAKGLSRAAIALNTSGLQDVTSLIYKEDPNTVENLPTTFSEMFKLAINKSGEGEEFRNFQSAIISDNTLFSAIAGNVLTAVSQKKDHQINLDQRLKATLSKLEKNKGIQQDSDLIKICWLFFAGNDAIDLAKKNTEFLKVLERAEQGKSNPITKPISAITTVEDVFESEAVKTLFTNIKAKLPEDALSQIAENSNSIISASDQLYSGMGMNKRANITDTIYYAIINSFGSPEDKVRLLKNPGNPEKFLAPEAQKELDRANVIMQGELGGGGRLFGGLKNPSKGRDYEKKRGNKAGSLGRGLTGFKQATPESDQVNSLVDQEIGKAMIFDGPTNEALRQLFTSDIFNVETLVSILKGKFHSVLVRPGGLIKNKEAYENLLKHPGKTPAHEVEAKVTVYNQAIIALNKYFDDFIKDVKSLQPEDLKRLSNLFTRSFSPSEKRGGSQANIDTETPNGKAILAYANAVLASLQTPSIQSGIADHVAEYAAKTKALSDKQNELKVLEKELKTLKSVKTDNTEGKESVSTELKALQTEIADTKEDIDNLKDAVAEADIKSKEQFSSSTVPDKLKAEAKLAETTLLDILKYTDETKMINAEKLEKVLRRLSPELLGDVNVEVEHDGVQALESVLSNESIDEETEEWKEWARIALKKIKSYLETPELASKEAASRRNAFERLMFPVKQDLEERSEAAWHEKQDKLTPKKAQKGKIASELTNLERLTQQIFTDIVTFARDNGLTVEEKTNIFSGKEYFSKDLTDLIEKFKADNCGPSEAKFIDGLLKNTTFAEMEKTSGKRSIDLDTEQEDPETVEDKKKVIAGTYSLIPGSALKGAPSIMLTNELDRYLFQRNFLHLNDKAKAFYTEVGKFVKNYKLYKPDLASWTRDIYSAENIGFLDAFVDLIATFKANLSTDSSAADLENSQFLDELLTNKDLDLDKSNVVPGRRPGSSILVAKKTATLDTNFVKDKIKASLPFENFVERIYNSIQSGTLDWPVKKVVAPVINLGGSGTLGLKSATLLNLISSLKNFESPTVFDISLNKRGEDVLSNILNTKKYAGKFAVWDDLALIIKLYFLITLKTAVTDAEVIKKFSEDFIKVEVELPGEDELTKKLKASLENLNKAFQSTVSSEFLVDFGEGGTLDLAIKFGIDLLKEMSKASDGSVTLIKHGNVTSVPLPEDVYTFVKTLGGEDSFTFIETGDAFKASTISSPAMEKLLSLLFNENKKALTDALNSCILIIKNGLSFYCGDQITRALAKHKAYDPVTGERNAALIDEMVSGYRLNKDFVAFTSRFKTTEDAETGYIETQQVNPEANERQGFLNIKNAFLESFVKDFTWDAVTDPISMVYVDEFVGEAERPSDVPENAKEIEEACPVFVAGLFEKTVGKNGLDPDQIRDSILTYKKQIEASAKAENEEDRLSEEEITNAQQAIEDLKASLSQITAEFGTEKAAGIIKAKQAAATSATNRLDDTGTIPGATTVPTTTNSDGTIVIHVKQKAPANFINVTKVIKAGRKKGQRTGDRTKGNKVNPEGGKVSYTEIKPIGQTLTEFSDGLRKTAWILNRVYDNGEEIIEYSQSIMNSVEGVKNAITNIAANPYAENVQREVAASLSDIPAKPKPTVPLFVSPSATIKKANDSFEQDGIFYNVHSFASSAAKDIVDGKTTLPKILEAINTLTSTENKDTTASAADIEPVKPKDPLELKKKKEAAPFDPANVNTSVYNFFNSEMTNSTAYRRLQAIVKNLVGNVLVKNAPEFIKIKTNEINALKSANIGDEKEVANYRAQIKTQIDSNMPQGVDANSAAGKEAYNNLLNSAPVVAIKQKLGPAQERIANRTKKIVDLETAVSNVQRTGTASNKEAAVVDFLNALYSRGNMVLKDLSKKLTDEPNNTNKRIIYDNQIVPLHNKVAVVQKFVDTLSDEFGRPEVLDRIQMNFGKLNNAVGSIKAPVVEGIIGLQAVHSFNRLLQEAANEDLPEEVPQALSPEEQAEWDAIKAENDKEDSEFPTLKTESEISNKITQISSEMAELKGLDSPTPEQEARLKRLNAAYNSYHEDIVALKTKYNVESRPYIVAMAKHLLEIGETVETYVDYEEVKGIPQKVMIVPESIQAAVISLLGQKKDFALLRGAINSPIYMSIAVQVPGKVGRLSEMLHITDFYSMKMFASLDKFYILKYTNTEDPAEDEE